MVFVIVFLLNAAANFALGLALSAILGPTQYGRFATIALAATVMALSLFDWLRLASLRFSGAREHRETTQASLDASYIAMIVLAILVGAVLPASGFDFRLGKSAGLLTAFLALAGARFEYCGAQMRARGQTRPFIVLSLIRQSLVFVLVLGAAAWLGSSDIVVAAFALTQLASVILIGPLMRTQNARLDLLNFGEIVSFAAYAKPIVVATIIYYAISLINRQIALTSFGAEATGKLALATDLGLRLFIVANILPETLLFQLALRREREHGPAAARRQISVNHVLVLCLIGPVAAGYMTMAPTFEALVVPLAYRGDYARLSVELAPGLFAFCALSSMWNPVFQIARRTWPSTLAAFSALGADLILVHLPFFSQSVDGVAISHSASLVIGSTVAAVLALRRPDVRPSLRDVAAIAGGTLAMSVAIRPLNAIHPASLAAATAILVGGAVIAGTAIAFDVAGLRSMAIRRLRERRLRAWVARLQG